MYVIGNSVARQSLFNMVKLLGGDLIKRENQRDMCPKHETTWDDSCHQQIGDIRLKYLFLQFPDGYDYTDRNGFPYFKYKKNVVSTDNSTGEGVNSSGIAAPSKTKSVWVTDRLINSRLSTSDKTVYYNKPNDAPIADKLWDDDNCILHDTRSCFSRFFANSTSSDVLIFTLGMTFPVLADNEWPHSSPAIDFTAWLKDAATAFRGHLAATFKGQVFHNVLAETNKYREVAHMIPYLDRTNYLLRDIWRPNSEDLPWYTTDQWSINKNRHDLYDDHIHFNCPLTFAMLHQGKYEM